MERARLIMQIRQDVHQLEPLTPDLKVEFANKHIYSLEGYFMRDLHRDPTFFSQGLAEIKKLIKEAKGGELTPAALTAEYVTQFTVLHFDQTAILAVEIENAGAFTVMADAGFGAREATGRILLASRSDDRDKIITRGVNNTIAILDETDLVEGAELYLQLTAEAQRLSARLAEDPTGFSLFDEFISELRTTPEKHILPYLHPEYVIAGAEVASNIYKRLYPLAARLGNPR